MLYNIAFCVTIIYELNNEEYDRFVDLINKFRLLCFMNKISEFIITIYVSPRQRLKIEHLSKKLEISISKFVRLFLDSFKNSFGGDINA